MSTQDNIVPAGCVAAVIGGTITLSVAGIAVALTKGAVLALVVAPFAGLLGAVLSGFAGMLAAAKWLD